MPTDDSRCKVVTIVLNFNGSRDTRECIESVLLEEYGKDAIVLLDNGSAEGDFEALRLNLGGRITLLRLSHNKGVAAGWNYAVKHVRGVFKSEYIFLLNNDAVVARGLIQELVEYADSLPNSGAVGPSIMKYGTPSKNQYSRLEGIRSPKVDYRLSGCALLIRSQIFDTIGYFDEDYFAYGEESDLLERMRKTHWVPYYVPTSSKVYHKGGHTASSISGFEAFHKTRNRLLFAGKNLGGIQLLGNVASFLFKTLPIEIVGDVLSQNRAVRLSARTKGFAEGVGLFFRVRRNRRSEL